MKTLLFVIVQITFISCQTPTGNNNNNTEHNLADSTKKAQESELRNAFTASKLMLKKSLKDPESFEIIKDERNYLNDFVKDKSKYIQIFIKYRAKNSFNGTVVDSQCFIYNKKGDLTDSFKCEDK
jgi:hypothetical protein